MTELSQKLHCNPLLCPPGVQCARLCDSVSLIMEPGLWEITWPGEGSRRDEKEVTQLVFYEANQGSNLAKLWRNAYLTLRRLLHFIIDISLLVLKNYRILYTLPQLINCDNQLPETLNFFKMSDRRSSVPIDLSWWCFRHTGLDGHGASLLKSMSSATNRDF